MSTNILKIKFGDEEVGQLSFDTENDLIKLNYTNIWVKNGFPLSPHLPLTGECNSNSIKRFLENLFPEGAGLEELLEINRISKRNFFRITQLIGKDTTGALEFISTEENESIETSFRELTPTELEDRLNTRAKTGLVVWDGKVRLSVAGVQDKLPITILKNGKIGFGEGELASTHILKFQKEDEKVPHLVLNEYFSMKLAEKIGLKTAEVEFKKFGKHPVLIVKRFDRKKVSDKKVLRSHIIDGCQALDMFSSFKYEKNFGSGKDVAHIRDGVSLEKLFALATKTKTPAVTIQQIVRWTLFNILITNSDAHGKNISFYMEKGSDLLELTPWYDLVSVGMYKEIDTEFAMAIGDEFNIEEVFTYQLRLLADENNINPRIVYNELKNLIKKIKTELTKIKIPEETIEKEEIKFWEDMIKHVKERVKVLENIEKDFLEIEL